MRFDRIVNFGALANQRFREFWADISGSDVDLQGPGRTPRGLCRTRDFFASGESDASPCEKGGKRKNAESGNSRRSVLTPQTVRFVGFK
jgi:hypothetical protein